MKNYEEFINTRFDKSTEIDDKVADFLAKEDYKTLLDYLRGMGAKELALDYYSLLFALSEYTTENGIYNNFELLKKHLMNNQDFITDVREEYNAKFGATELIIETTSMGTISVYSLSKLIPPAKERIGTLETKDRYGDCNQNSKTISLNIGKKNDLVIGYIYGYTDISQFLHQWVEVTLKGKEYVIDSILNIVISKEAYYTLFRVEVLNKVSNEVIKEDIKNYLADVGVFPIEPYLIYHDNIMNDFEKNKEIFKK